MLPIISRGAPCDTEIIHVKTRPSNAVAHGIVDRALPGVWNSGGISKENHIEAATLGGARHLFEHADVGMMMIDPRSGEPPVRLDVGPGNIDRQSRRVQRRIRRLSGYFPARTFSSSAMNI